MPCSEAKDIDDYTGDVLLYSYQDGISYSIDIQERPHIDIVELRQWVDEERLFLQMTVLDDVQIHTLTVYAISFSCEDLGYYFGYWNGSVLMNSSSYIMYEMDANSLCGVFSIEGDEDFSSYDLFGVSIDIGEENECMWVDEAPDRFPPFLFVNMGAGRFSLPFGRGISVKLENKHQYESVTGSVEVFFNGTLGIQRSSTSIDFTVPPKEQWEFPYSIWTKRPLCCDATVKLTVHDASYRLFGRSLGQWYFFDSWEGDMPIRNFTRFRDNIDKFITLL